MQISLSKVYAIIDKERGYLLADLEVAGYSGAHQYEANIKDRLRLLNKLKEKFARVSDADQLPLGL